MLVNMNDIASPKSVGLLGFMRIDKLLLGMSLRSFSIEVSHIESAI